MKLLASPATKIEPGPAAVTVCIVDVSNTGTPDASQSIVVFVEPYTVDVGRATGCRKHVVEVLGELGAFSISAYDCDAVAVALHAGDPRIGIQRKLDCPAFSLQTHECRDR